MAHKSVPISETTPPQEVNFFAVETEERGIPLKDKIISLAQVNIYDRRVQKIIESI